MNSTTSHMDNWAGLLVDPSICEIGGENNNEGVDYARYLAMAFIIQMESEHHNDYVVLFEYLQDIALIDSSKYPTSAKLVQVKKKSRGTWSKAALCREDKSNNNPNPTAEVSPEKNQKKKSPAPKKLGAKSPLGKLHLCVEKLSATVPTSGIFISNAAFDVKDSAGTLAQANTALPLDTLHIEEVKYVKEKLCKELGVTSLPHLSKISLEQSKIIPAAMRETVRGMIDEMLAKNYPTLPNISGRLQEQLLSIFSALSGPPGLISSLAEILERKGFTRKQFTDVVTAHAATRNATDDLDMVIEGLKKEGMAARAADRLRTQASRLQIQLVRQPDAKEALNWDTAVQAARTYIDSDSYIEIINRVEAALVASKQTANNFSTSDNTISAIALLALIYVDKEPPALSSQFTNKNP